MSIDYESLIGTFEQKKAAVAQLNLMDDIFFSEVMKDKAACEYLLEKILGRPFHVIENKTQYSIRNIAEHSVVLDLLVEDFEHKVYDIEVHTGVIDNLIKRIRYYQSAINWSILEKSKDYKKLTDTYIIYITQNDFLKKGRNKYEIVKRIIETDEPYEDGEHLLFLNTEVRDGTDLSEFLQYMKKSDADNGKFGSLSKAVKYHKANENGVRFMCKIMEELWADGRMAGIQEGEAKGRMEGLREGIAEGALKGRAEGIKEGKAEAIRKMLSKGMDIDEALALIELDRKTYEEFSGRVQ